jgi:hypothetical protein
MIKDYSLIKNGKVVNRIVADAGFIKKIEHEYDHITDDVKASMGFEWDGERFTPSGPKPPKERMGIDAIIQKLSEMESKINALGEKEKA